MNERLLLNGQWEMRDERLSFPLSAARKLSHVQEDWIPQPVPGDIHQGLCTLLMAFGAVATPGTSADTCLRNCCKDFRGCKSFAPGGCEKGSRLVRNG